MRTVTIVLLIVADLAFVVLSAVGFKWAAQSQGWPGFLRGQVVGNLAGFAGVIALTLLTRELALYRAYAIHAGVASVLVEVLAAGLFFHEPVGPAQWGGSLLVLGGVLLILAGRHGHIKVIGLCREGPGLGARAA